MCSYGPFQLPNTQSEDMLGTFSFMSLPPSQSNTSAGLKYGEALMVQVVKCEGLGVYNHFLRTYSSGL